MKYEYIRIRNYVGCLWYDTTEKVHWIPEKSDNDCIKEKYRKNKIEHNKVASKLYKK